MSDYSIYNPLKSEMVRQASPAFDKRERKRADFPQSVVRHVLNLKPALLQTLEARILMDEVAWTESGHTMYFPDSSELLDMLWRAKVDVRVEDLGLEKFPRAFAFAWPKCLVDGVQPKGCLIWFGDAKDRLHAVDRFEGYYFKTHEWKKDGPSTLPDDQPLGIHMSTRLANPPGSVVPSAYARASIPENLFKQGLSSDKDFERCFKTYTNPILVGVIPLTPEEAHILYVTFKLAMRMLVYMQACPDCVKVGFPGGKNRKAFEGRWDNFTPNVIGSPARLTSGEHGSPISHMRSWFFRSYPVKKDGKRRNGVVFVRATVVNAEVGPMTVEEGGAI